MHGLEAGRALADLGCRRARYSAREGDAVRADELDRVSRLETTVAAGHAHREQAPPVVDDRAPSAHVDVQGAGRLLREPEPELVRGELAARTLEARATRLTGEDRAEHVLSRSLRDDGGDPRLGGHPRRDHLASHAAAAKTRSVSERDVVEG